MSKDDSQAFIAAGLAWLFDELETHAHSARIIVGHNDAVLAVFVADDGNSASIYAFPREEVRGQIQANLPEAVKTIERLSKPCVMTHLTCVITHKDELWSMDYPLRGSLGVLN